VHLRLDLDLGDPDAAQAAMSISLSKWPMLPTIARCFIAAMCSMVMTSRQPVA
jgi:hypothetical protein